MPTKEVAVSLQINLQSSEHTVTFPISTQTQPYPSFVWELHITMIILPSSHWGQFVISSAIGTLQQSKHDCLWSSCLPPAFPHLPINRKITPPIKLQNWWDKYLYTMTIIIFMVTYCHHAIWPWHTPKLCGQCNLSSPILIWMEETLPCCNTSLNLGGNTSGCL